MIGDPYAGDKILKGVSYDILNDPNDQNLTISRDKIKTDLEQQYANGQISEETYKYINEQLLYSKTDQIIDIGPGVRNKYGKI